MLAPWIISNFPKHRVYVEPYGGAASVLIRKPRSYAEVYNDLDGDVVNLFRVIQNHKQSSELADLLTKTPFARAEFELAHEETVDPVERARRIIIRSFMGFGSAASRIDYNTGFRSNSNRSGTTPAHDWTNYPDCVPIFTERMRGVVIESKPATDLMLQHDTAETLFYVDPPYPVQSRKTNGDCYAFEMTDDDHRELAKVVGELKGMVIVSGYECELYDELFAGWTQVRRAALADGAAKRVEILWMNDACVSRSQVMDLFAVAQ